MLNNAIRIHSWGYNNKDNLASNFFSLFPREYQINAPEGVQFNLSLLTMHGLMTDKWDLKNGVVITGTGLPITITKPRGNAGQEFWVTFNPL